MWLRDISYLYLSFDVGKLNSRYTWLAHFQIRHTLQICAILETVRLNVIINRRCIYVVINIVVILHTYFTYVRLAYFQIRHILLQACVILEVIWLNIIINTV